MTVNAFGPDHMASPAIAADAVTSPITAAVKQDVQASELGRNGRKQKLKDNNAIVKVGTVVAGRFVKKLDRMMVVRFKIGSKKCSGILHVSQFPSSDRSTRDKMFELVKVERRLFKLTVIQVIPPGGKHRLTRVFLTSREDFDERIFRRSSMARHASLAQTSTLEDEAPLKIGGEFDNSAQNVLPEDDLDPAVLDKAYEHLNYPAQQITIITADGMMENHPDFLDGDIRNKRAGYRIDW